MSAANDNRPDDTFGLCPVCHRTDGVLNVGRIHWFFCDAHRSRWCYGENIFSDWRDETEAVWLSNSAKLGQFREVKPFYWPETLAAEVDALTAETAGPVPSDEVSPW